MLTLRHLLASFATLAAIAVPGIASAQSIQILDPAGDLTSGNSRTLTIEYTAPVTDPVITFTTADNFRVTNLTLPGTFQSWYTWSGVPPASQEIAGLPGCIVVDDEPWKSECRWVRIGNESTTTSFTVTVQARQGAFPGIDQGTFGRINSTNFSAVLSAGASNLATDLHTVPVTQSAPYNCINWGIPITTTTATYDTGSTILSGIEVTAVQLCQNNGGSGMTDPNPTVQVTLPSAGPSFYYLGTTSWYPNLSVVPDATAANPALPGGTVTVGFPDGLGTAAGPLTTGNSFGWLGTYSAGVYLRFFVPCSSLPLTSTAQPTATYTGSETRFEADGVTPKTISYTGNSGQWFGASGFSVGGACGESIPGSIKTAQRPTTSYDEPMFWSVFVKPFTGWNTVTEVVVADPIPGAMRLYDTDSGTAGFQNATVIAPGAPLTFYYCELAAGFNRTDFLSTWRTNPAVCGENDLPTGAVAGDVTHVVAYAPSWAASADIHFRIWTELRPGATQGQVIENTATMTAVSPTGDVTPPLGLTAQVTVDLLARPRIGIGGIWGEQIGNPGQVFNISVQPRREGSWAPYNDWTQGRWLLNPRIEVQLPPGFAPASGATTPVAINYNSCAEPVPTVPPELTWSQNVAGVWTLEAHWDENDGSGWFGPSCWIWYGPSLLTFDVVAQVGYPFVNGVPNTFEARLFVDNTVTDLPASPAPPRAASTYGIEINVARELELEILPDSSSCENGIPGPPAYLLDFGNPGGTHEQGVTIWANLPSGTSFLSFSGLPAGAQLAYATDVSANPVNHTWIAGNPPVNDPSVTAVRVTIPTVDAYDLSGAVVLQVTTPAGATTGTVVPMVAAIGSTGPAPGLTPVQSTGSYTIGDCPSIIVLTKYFDSNNNGVLDPGEEVLEGWNFEVDDGGVVTTVGPTNALGQVTFALTGDLATVTEIAPAGAQTWALSGATMTPSLTLASVPMGVSFTPTGGNFALNFGNTCSCPTDGDPCTTDLCTPDGCSYPVVPNDPPVACDDGLVCTTSDSCVNGGCAGVAVVCGPGDICTIDGTGVCIEPDGCVYETISCDPFQFYVAVKRPDGTLGSVSCTLGATIECETGPGGVLVIGPPQCGD